MHVVIDLRYAATHVAGGLVLLVSLSCSGGSPTGPRANAIRILPDTVTLDAAGTTRLSATVVDAAGHVVSGQAVTWSSGAPAIASVAVDGTVSGKTFGSTIITAASDGLKASATVRVADTATIGENGGTISADSGAVRVIIPRGAMPATTVVSVAPALEVSPDPRLLRATAVELGPRGATFSSPVTVELSYARTPLPAGFGPSTLALYSSPDVKWSLLGSSVVDSAAKVVSAITSHFSLFSIGATQPAASAIISSPESTIAIGDSVSATAIMLDSFGDTLPQSLVSWQSSDTSVIEVTNRGLLSSVSPGSAKITARSGTVSGSISIESTLGVKQTLYVVNSNNSITAYAPGDTGNVSPALAIQGSNTGLLLPTGIVRDATGKLYVSNSAANSITIYAAGSTGNTVPVAVIQGSNTGLSQPSALALDASGRLYVANGSTNTITIYAPGSSGNTAPSATIQGSSTGLLNPDALTFDASGELYVANFGFFGDGSSVTIYAKGATGNIAPIVAIQGAQTGLTEPTGVAVDPSGNVYVANRGATGPGSITVYARTASGNAAPTATIMGSKAMFTDLRGVTLDPSHRLLYIADFAVGVLIYSRHASGNAAPLATIAGSLTGATEVFAVAF